MSLFQLPHTAKVQKVIPKNAFDTFATAKQKRLFTEKIARITWLYKLAPDTVKLDAKEVKEIQIFKVELKVKDDVAEILDLIDKSIPYNIIFIVEFGQELYLSASTKHSHPINLDKAVIDWTFRSQWFSPEDNSYSLNLKRNIDFVLLDFCNQLSGADKAAGNKSLEELVHYSKQKYILEKEIEQLKKNIKNCKQYKLKVEMNLELKKRMEELVRIIS